jgi:RNA polymerase sigma factor (sigma-70 family)
MNDVVNRWETLRERSVRSPVVPITATRLPVRCKKLIDTHAVRTVQELLALDPTQLARRRNIGRTTLANLLNEADRVLSGDAAPQSFVQLVNLTLASLPERSKQIVLSRTERKQTLEQLAEQYGITRERVRQIEAKFIKELKDGCRRQGILDDSILDDGQIDVTALCASQRELRYSRPLYLALARTVLGGSSMTHARRYYNEQTNTLIEGLAQDDSYLTASFTVTRLRRLVRKVAPALNEVGDAELLDVVAEKIGGSVVNGILLGKKPGVGRIIRALLRKAGGTASIQVLLEQLAAVLAAYDEISYFDTSRLRAKLHSMPDVHLLTEDRATLKTLKATVEREWLANVVGEILAAGKPYSIVRFLDDHDDAPFDAFALASLLRAERSVVHVGRRLYSAKRTKKGPIRTWQLVLEALRKDRGPMTRSDLLHYVRERRDLKCGQIENYFKKVPGLVRYTRDIVGLVPLSRRIMVQILMRESTVRSLLREATSSSNLVHSAALWLEGAGDADLSQQEEIKIAKSARCWRTVRVEQSTNGLYFSIREAR